MITCILCGDTNGPWALYDGIGFVYEDCIENGSLEAELEAKKRLNQDDKGEL